MPQKRHRLAITFAGGYFELCLWALAVGVWRVTQQQSAVNYLAWIIVSICSVRVLFNFIPLIKLDGYYLLSDLLDIAKLRQRALDYVAGFLRWGLWGAAWPAREVRRALLLSKLAEREFSTELTASPIRGPDGQIAGCVVIFHDVSELRGLAHADLGAFRRQVQRLANYGLKDGRIFDFISRTTPTSGQELSYLTPLFKLLSFN